jgi:hypothetical protein
MGTDFHITARVVITSCLYIDISIKSCLTCALLTYKVIIMKLIKIAIVLPLLNALVGCNSTGLNNRNVDTMPTASGKYNLVTVYKTRAEIPRNSKIKGIARVQNYYPNGAKVPSEVIIEELKTQAALSGGTGIFNVVPGAAQTTADIVFAY